MKNTVRAHHNGATKGTNSQVEIHPRLKPATAAPTLKRPFISADAASEANDALSQMQRVGRAACTLLVFVAEDIRTAVNNYAGWESLNLPGAGAGALELAQTINDEFESCLTAKANELQWMLGHSPAPAKPVENWELENVVGALQHCLEMLCGIASDRRNIDYQLAHNSGNILGDRLRSAWKTFHKSLHNLRSEFNENRSS